MVDRSPGFHLVNGSPEDAVPLAKLHVEVWRETYLQIAPPEAVLRLDETRRLPYWRATLASQEPDVGAVVGKADGVVAGVVSFGPATHSALGGAAEIKHFYVRGPARGNGLGKRLLHAAFSRLRACGYAEAALAVVRENEGARRFYETMGGVEAGAFIDPGPLWRSSNIVVKWKLDAPAGASPRMAP